MSQGKGSTSTVATAAASINSVSEIASRTNGQFVE